MASFEPHDYRVVFVIQKSACRQNEGTPIFIWEAILMLKLRFLCGVKIKKSR
jgi:hypothetical protein